VTRRCRQESSVDLRIISRPCLLYQRTNYKPTSTIALTLTQP
jgi:hypothetical protein